MGRVCCGSSLTPRVDAWSLPSPGVPSLATCLRVVRFAIAGGGSLLVDVVLQRLFRAGFGIPVSVAPALSYELGLLMHFVMLSLWVFHEPVTLRRLAQFHVTALTAAAITLGITYGLLSQPVVPYFVDPTGPFGTYGPEAAKLVGTATAMGWTFVSSFFWIWKRPAEEGQADADAGMGTGKEAVWAAVPEKQAEVADTTKSADTAG
jgi:putative flippase GtrA